MLLRRPGGHLSTVAWEDDARTSRAVLPIGVDAGNHVAGYRRPVATHSRGVRRLLERRLPARRHRRAGAHLPTGSFESANVQSGSGTAVPATAEVPHHRVPGTGVP